MATSADVAMVAIRRLTGIFSRAGVAPAGVMADGTAPGVSAGADWSAVGVSVAAGAAAGGATCGQGSRAAGWRGGAGSGAAGLLAGGGLAWDPLCQVRARITWVGVSLTSPGRLEALVRDRKSVV